MDQREKQKFIINVIWTTTRWHQTRRFWNKWKLEFSNLYNPTINSSFDSEFRNSAIYQNQVFEQNMTKPTYISFLEQTYRSNLNKQRSLTKQRREIHRNYNLPAEVLKNETVIKALHKLFNFIFESNKIPSVWKKAIIFPILKERNSDYRISLTYRGISLLSVISKVHVYILQCKTTG